MKEQNIILIGFMGAGKTSVGDRLAKRGGTVLIDTDRMIEEKARMTVSRIFETRGETYFRKLETEVLQELLRTAKGDIISVGGGLPLREENRSILKELGEVIYLKVQPETVFMRLQGDRTRPLLQAEDVEERIRTLLAERGPVYEAAAHRTVAVDGQTTDEIADVIDGTM